MGDQVGYGPDPSVCLALLRKYDLLAVAGNHEHAVVGRTDPGDFNGALGAAARWNEAQLPPEKISYLCCFPLVTKSGPFTLVHCNLRPSLGISIGSRFCGRHREFGRNPVLPSGPLPPASLIS